MDKKVKQFVFFISMTYVVLMPAMIYLLTIKLFKGDLFLFLLFAVPIYLVVIPNTLANIKSMMNYGLTMTDVEFSQKGPKTGSDWIVFKNFQAGYLYLTVILLSSAIAILAAKGNSAIVAIIASLFAIAGSRGYYQHLIKMKYMGKQ